MATKRIFIAKRNFFLKVALITFLAWAAVFSVLVYLFYYDVSGGVKEFCNIGIVCSTSLAMVFLSRSLSDAYEFNRQSKLAPDDTDNKSYEHKEALNE